MTYLLAGSVFLASLVLVACSVIYITPGSDQPVNIQSTDPVNILGSQNVTSSDRASKAGAEGDVKTKASADATPTTVLAPTIPMGQ